MVLHIHNYDHMLQFKTLTYGLMIVFLC